MKILHTSDWHLGLDLCQISLLEYQKAWSDWLCDTIQQHKIDAVLICGDVFDRAVSSPEAIRLYSASLEKIHQAGAAVLMIAGNHDGAARLAACAPLLENSKIYIAGQLEHPVKIVEFPQARFFLLPYFAADRVKVLFPDATGMVDGTEMVLEQCKAACLPDKKNILLAHCFVAGGQAGESDRAAVVGGSAELPIKLFEDFDYVALGHIHRPQKLGENIRYCGTPMKYSFSEHSQTKTAPLYDTESGQVELIEIPEFVSLKVLTGDLEQLLQQSQQQDYENIFVKLVRTDGPADLHTQTQLRQAFPKVLQIEGRSAVMEQQEMGAIESLPPLELLRMFYKERTGQEPKPELEEWFLEMLEQKEEMEQ